MKKETRFKFIKSLIIFTIILLLTAVVFITNMLLKSEAFLYGNIITIIFIMFILGIVIFMVLSITKYKQSLISSDSEIPYFITLTLSFFIFMIVYGLIDILVFRTFENVHLLIIGVVMLINLILIKKRKGNKIKNGYEKRT